MLNVREPLGCIGSILEYAANTKIQVVCGMASTQLLLSRKYSKLKQKA